MAFVSIDYRLSPAVKHPAHIEDVARALAWVHKNAGKYGLDANQIFISGHSAGGHLVALLALDTRYLQQEGVPPGAIKGVIPTSGIYDVPRWVEPGKVPRGRDQAFGTADVMGQASPMRYVSAQAPPFLITFTDHDLYLMPEQAHEFYTACLKNRVNARLLQIMDRTHFDYMSGAGQPPITLVDDILAVELVSFATEVAGSTAPSSAALR